jgi:hypothetical protein
MAVDRPYTADASYETDKDIETDKDTDKDVSCRHHRYRTCARRKRTLRVNLPLNPT